MTSPTDPGTAQRPPHRDPDAVDQPGGASTAPPGRGGDAAGAPAGTIAPTALTGPARPGTGTPPSGPPVIGVRAGDGQDDFPAVRAAVDQLPMLPPDAPGDRYGIRRLTARWLQRSRRGKNRSAHTRKAYFRELAGYLHWCAQQDLDPLTARQADLDEFQDYRSRDRGTGAPAPASVARTLAAISSWYQYLVANTDGRVARNPVDGIERPYVPDESPTADLTPDQVDAVIAAVDAAADAARAGVLRRALGAAAAAALTATADAAGRRAGHQVLGGAPGLDPAGAHGEALLIAADLAAVRARDAVFARAVLEIAADAAAVAALRWHWTRYLSAVRDRALIRILADLGLRSAEVRGLDIASLSANAGRRTVRVHGKGGKTLERFLPADAAQALDGYLAVRARTLGIPVTALTGPLLATVRPDGSPGRMVDSQLFDLIRRLAKAAGIPHPERVSPHSLRHAMATRADELDVLLTRVQKAMGHTDPRTTGRYQHEHDALRNDPAHVLAADRQRRTSLRRIHAGAPAPAADDPAGPGHPATRDRP